MPTPTRLVSPQDLLTLACTPHFDTHPFIVKLSQGVYSRSDLQVLACKFFRGAKDFPYHLTRLYACCPVPTVKLHLLENLMSEEGFKVGNHEVEYNPDLCHMTWIQTFAIACGVSSNEIGFMVSQPPNQWDFDPWIEQNNWIAPLAYLLIATEANTSKIFQLMIPLLEQIYGFSPAELIFFTGHLELDQEHSSVGANLIAGSIHSQQDLHQAKLGIRLGKLSWWRFLESIDRDILARHS